ncbi:DUF1269 domain-containing protein [Granulicella pectinivorans]|nr:DUF1269 domain-containing protein [Granulicella pectinivorans]
MLSGSFIDSEHYVVSRGYSMYRTDSVVAISQKQGLAEQAVRDLELAGIDMQSVSLAARETPGKEAVTGYYSSGNRMRYWGARGAFFGAIWGLIFDTALFAIPGIGPVVLAGPLVSWIVAILEGAVVFGGLSALGAGLASIGIPKDSAGRYEKALQADKLLLIVHGTPDTALRAARVIEDTHHESFELHGATLPPLDAVKS